MLIGQAYSHILTPLERQALQESCDVLIDNAFDDLSTLESPQDVAHTFLVGHLPQRYIYKYTPLFFRQFTVCLITVSWKLAQAVHMPLSSLAEEIAAWTIIEEAKRLLEERSGGDEDENTLDDFIDVYFEDTDFLYLFENAHDGIEETQVGQVMGISSLAFDQWFVPFSDEPSRIAHPYVS
jgi:hypothetical protein